MAIADELDLREIAGEIHPRYAALRQAAEMYADHQKLRIVSDNRIFSLTVHPEAYSLKRISSGFATSTMCASAAARAAR